MTPEEIIEEVQEHTSEWLEMIEDPSALVAWVLANKVVKLNLYITYLEKRLSNESKQKISK